MRRTLWRCLVGLLVLGLSAAVPAQSLQFYTEEYPPLNYSRDGRPVGLAVDLVRELFERTGDHGRISVVPWARGYQAAQLEPNTALFVTMRTAERERLFKWVGPVVVAVTSFYALRGSGIRIERFEDVTRIGQVAVPRQWYSYQALQARGLPNLVGVKGPQQMMTMLRHGRVPVVVADNVTLEDLLALGDLRLQDVEPLHGFFEQRRLYRLLAQHPGQRDPELAAGAGLDEARRQLCPDLQPLAAGTAHSRRAAHSRGALTDAAARARQAWRSRRNSARLMRWRLAELLGLAVPLAELDLNPVVAQRTPHAQRLGAGAGQLQVLLAGQGTEGAETVVVDFRLTILRVAPAQPQGFVYRSGLAQVLDVTDQAQYRAVRHHLLLFVQREMIERLTMDIGDHHQVGQADLVLGAAQQLIPQLRHCPGNPSCPSS